MFPLECETASKSVSIENVKHFEKEVVTSFFFLLFWEGSLPLIFLNFS